MVKAAPKVLYEKRNGIAYVTLNRPRKYNAIDREMTALLHEIWLDFKRDDDAAVAIVSGRGGNFCAGFDLRAFGEELARGAYEWRNSAMFGDVPSLPNEHGVVKPVITAVQGNVNGMGAWLMLQGDIRIASEGARIGLGEVRFNIPVEFAALLARHIPFSIASDLLYTARTVTAGRLFDVGVINRIVPKRDLLSSAEQTAEDIRKGGREAIRVMKELIVKGQYLDEASAVSLTRRLAVPVVNSETTRNAVRAFANRGSGSASGRQGSRRVRHGSERRAK